MGNRSGTGRTEASDAAVGLGEIAQQLQSFDQPTEESLL